MFAKVMRFIDDTIFQSQEKRKRCENELQHYKLFFEL